MGLDMYSIAANPGLFNGSAGELPDMDNLPEEPANLHYWRKHANLHGWMTQLYRQKGGTGDFNLQFVKLTVEDLDQLEKDVQQARLPFTQGFFFGASENSMRERADTHDFIHKARAALANGKEVVYYAWW